MDALRPLRLNGTLRSTVHIANDYKVLSGMQQYPWAEAEGQTPLPADVMQRLRKQLHFGAWNASGGLYGTRAQVAEARRLVTQALFPEKSISCSFWTNGNCAWPAGFRACTG